MSISASKSPPKIVADAATLRAAVAAARAAGHTIGFVPTMGALHAGHLSLVEAAARNCETTVVSIFVNPTQFGAGEDFSRYPRNLPDDLKLLSAVDNLIVFTPSVESMYGPLDATRVVVRGPASDWEGRFRPDHFAGVATVVLKLFELVRPDRAYFGRKDYQQSLVVRRMVADLNVPVQVEVCPTVREPDGLALSSRNAYLSSDERRRALAISQSLRLAQQMAADGVRSAEDILTRMRATLVSAELQIDYVTLVDPDTLETMPDLDRPAMALVAARVGATRLIDNERIG